MKNFFLSPENSHPLSEKNKIKNGTTRHVLKDTLRVLHDKYKAIVEAPVSFATFKRLRPSNVKLSQTESLNQCLCEVCENDRLMLTVLNANISQDKKLKSLYDVSAISLCPTEYHFHELDCIQRQCSSCGIFKLEEYFTDLDNIKSVTWHIWENDPVTKRKVLKQKYESLQHLFKIFCDTMEPFPFHLFNAQWQLKEFSNMKNFPPHNTCTAVMDFAENYRCTLQDEAQSAH